MNEILKKDITSRANSIYEYLKGEVEKNYLEKWYDSKLEIRIPEDNEINGRSRCIGNIDYIEINSGVIDAYCQYFEDVAKYNECQILKKMNPNIDEKKIREYSSEGVIFKDGEIVQFDSKISVSI